MSCFFTSPSQCFECPFLHGALNVKVKKFNQAWMNNKSFGLSKPYSNYISFIIMLNKRLQKIHGNKVCLRKLNFKLTFLPLRSNVLVEKPLNRLDSWIIYLTQVATNTSKTFPKKTSLGIKTLCVDLVSHVTFSNLHKSNKTHDNTKLWEREEDEEKKWKNTTFNEMEKTILLA